MNIRLKRNVSITDRADVIVIPLFQNTKKITGFSSDIDKELGGKISELLHSGDISGEKGCFTNIYSFNKLQAKCILCIGLGKKKDYSYEILRSIAGEVSRKLKELKAKKATWVLDNLFQNNLDCNNLIQTLAEGLLMGSYIFSEYKSNPKKKKEHKVDSIYLAGFPKGITQKTNKSLELGCITGESVNIARDLANRTANDLTPKTFLDFAKLKLSKTSIDIEVIDRAKALSLNMNAFLGVAKGSNEEPFMLVLKHLPQKQEKPTCIIGKGITFDSGGISIKPSKGMSDMKADMSGAAAVLASMIAISKINPAKNIMAIIPLAENMPSGHAQRPGDVVTAMNGKTIEILNTDAEGRLILADALCYAVKENVKEIIDIATLTGASIIALGDEASAILGNNQNMINKLIKIGQATGDKLWQLPLFDEYLEYIKSDIADIANANEDRKAGTITAAKFLEQFVDKTPWVHIDIACQMSIAKTKGYRIKGMSGVGVRNILSYLIGK
jgi:leucyl aminopeptidase